MFTRYQESVNAGDKVLIGFRLGDLWADTFTYTKGKRIGEQGVSLKARLLFIHFIKINGVLVYKAEPKTVPESEQISLLQKHRFPLLFPKLRLLHSKSRPCLSGPIFFFNIRQQLPW